MPSQSGRRALVTGANSGIGFETARALARMDAEVIVPARTWEKANGTVERIRSEMPAAKVMGAQLDLASLASVREFALWYCERYPGPSLDLLIQNAGVMGIPKRELTEDGFERQFATNFLGPFALTALLWAHMRSQAGSRIVVVASSTTKWAKLDFENLQSERRYRPIRQAYSQSKLADLLFALELQRRLTKAGSPVIAVSAHPGYAVTNIQTSGPGKNISVYRILTGILQPIFAQDATEGALPTLYAATAPEIEAGGYYGPDGWMELKGYPRAVAIPPRALDREAAARLWREAERLTGIAFEPEKG